MSSLAKKGLGTPVLKNDRLKNAVKRSNLLKRVEEIQRIVEPIELTLDALLGNENNNDDATLLGNLQNLQPSTKIVKNSKQPQKVCQPLQKKRADKENDIPETKASLNTLVTRPVPIPIRPGQDEKAMLNAVYQSMVYTDVTFMVEEQEFPAHRGILAARCRYFEKLFTSKGQGKGDRIQFTELSAKAFPILIKFIYGQEIELTEDTALELINITDKYCLPLLSKKLEEFLNASLAKDNIVRFTKMAEVMKNVRLKTLVLAFARKNLGSLAQNGDILRVIKHI